MRGWRAVLWKEFWDSGWCQIESESAVCPGSPKGQLHPAVPQAQGCCWVRERVVPLHSLLCVALPTATAGLVPQYKKDVKLFESVQRRAIKIGNILECKTYEEWLRSLGFFSPDKRRLKGGLMAAYSFLTEGSGGEVPCSSLWWQQQDPREWHGGWRLGKVYSLRGWSGTGTGFWGQWSWSQACWSLRSIWTILSDILFEFWLVLNFCLAMGWAWWSLWTSFNSGYFMISWFYDHLKFPFHRSDVIWNMLWIWLWDV